MSVWFITIDCISDNSGESNGNNDCKDVIILVMIAIVVIMVMIIVIMGLQNILEFNKFDHCSR